MNQGLPYCGAPPVPGELLGRFNGDPILITALILVAALHVRSVAPDRGRRAAAVGGWLVAAVALVSPLCALSVALFSARVGQHMILTLVAAPLIAVALPRVSVRPASLWAATVAFFVALWFWHMPLAYDATFGSGALGWSIYWSMHLTLFGSAIWLWSALLGHDRDGAVAALCAGTLTSIHMGLLGAVLTLSSRAWFAPHYQTVEAWGFTPLSDQQLGGVLMWVPGCVLFLLVALRSARLFWQVLEPAKAA
jgi:putative membrane protein